MSLKIPMVYARIQGAKLGDKSLLNGIYGCKKLIEISLWQPNLVLFFLEIFWLRFLKK